MIDFHKDLAFATTIKEFETHGVKVKRFEDGGLYSEKGDILYVAPRKKVVYVKEGCRYIAPFAFSKESRRAVYREVWLPDGVEEICESAFAACSNLWFVELPTSLKVIERCAFWQCYKLDRLIIPKGIERIGEAAVLSNDILMSADLEPVIVGNELFSSGSIAEDVIEIPDGIEYVSHMSFAFDNNLRKVVIPMSVKKVDDQAFWECKNLKGLVVKSPKVFLYNAFGWGYCYPTRLVVPKGRLSFYKPMGELWEKRGGVPVEVVEGDF